MLYFKNILLKVIIFGLIQATAKVLTKVIYGALLSVLWSSAIHLTQVWDLIQHYLDQE